MSPLSPGSRAIVLAACVCAVPAAGRAGTLAYVTAGDQVLAVQSSGPATVVHTSSCGLLSGDLAFGGDGLVYFAEPGCLRISRLDPSARVRRGVNESYQPLFTRSGGPGSPGAATEIRLTAELDVLFNTEGTGVWKLARGTFAASPVAGGGGLGLAIAHNGNVIFLNGAQVEQYPAPAFFTPFSAAGAVGLGVTNGGQGTSVRSADGTPRLATGTICYSTANTIRCARKDGSNDTLYATFPAAEHVRYFEFLSDDTAIVGTAENPALGTLTPNGRLYRVDGTGVRQIYATAKVAGRYQPINGVANLASDQTIVEMGAVSGFRLFDYGDFEVRIATPGACALSVTASQVSTAAAQGLLDTLDTSGTNNVYLTAPLLGEESQRTRVDVTVLSGLCEAPVTVYMAGFFDDPFGQTWALAHFKLMGSQVLSSEVITDGFFPFAAPDDIGLKGRTDDFSIFLPAVVRTIGQTATFCRFLPALDDRARVPPLTGAETFATGVNLGSVIAVKFRLSTDGCSTTFVADNPNYPREGAVVSVMRLSDGAIYSIDAPGSANDPPVFRIDSDGITHIFNLKTTPTALAPWTRGLHVLTVSSLDALFTPASILINVQ